MTSLYLAVFVGAILLSFILTRSVRNTAKAKGWTLQPTSKHHIHTASVPRLGGVAIFFTFLLITGMLLVVSIIIRKDLNLPVHTIVYLLVSGTLVFLVGLYDDCYSVSPYIKFAVQVLAGIILYSGGFRVLQIPLLFGSSDLGWVSLPLTIFWVILITNAFNLIDGIDGLAAGSALFSTLTVFIVSLVSGNFFVSVMTVGLAGAILGFLRFNFNPATIFLGDSGSLFIGFILSALALSGAQKSPTMIAVAIPVVSFGLPILETTISVLRRYLSGQPIFGADREHIHHKLLARGLSQRQAVVLLYGVSAGCGLMSLFLLYPSGPTVGIVFFVVGVGLWIGIQRLGYHEFLELGRVAQRTKEQKKVIINNLAIRRATERLAQANEFKQIQHILEEAFEKNDFDSFQLCSGVALRDTASDAGKCCSDLPHTDAYCCFWNKASEGGLNDHEGSPKWELKLELRTVTTESLGELSLHRTCNGKSLMLDINLLTSNFQCALAIAIKRIHNPTLNDSEYVLQHTLKQSTAAPYSAGHQ
jgi:UDP-GlcNAc:undecaprenyl-phosphate GlcNAc-1-phosphate transferase